jgi:hypothetical protein
MPKAATSARTALEQVPPVSGAIPLANICSLTDFQRSAKSHVADLRKSGQARVLTVNGQAELVVQHATAYQQLLDAIEEARGRVVLLREELATAREQLAIQSALGVSMPKRAAQADVAIADAERAPEVVVRPVPHATRLVGARVVGDGKSGTESILRSLEELGRKYGATESQ